MLCQEAIRLSKRRRVTADRLLTVCLADERVDSATVTVHKPEAPVPHTFTDVAVTMTRARAR